MNYPDTRGIHDPGPSLYPGQMIGRGLRVLDQEVEVIDNFIIHPSAKDLPKMSLREYGLKFLKA